MKLKATAMFYALMVTLLMGLLSAGMLLTNLTSTLELEAYQSRDRQILNCASGLEYAKAMLQEGMWGQRWIDMGDDPRDSVYVELKEWGSYAVLISRAIHQGSSIEKCQLVGNHPENNYGLYLAETGSALTLAGQCQISGKTYLPKAGARRGHIGSQYFLGNRLINGTQNQSRSELPFWNLPRIQDSSSEEDSLIHISDFDHPYERSFVSSTAKIETNDSLVMRDLTIRGNVHIASSRAIVVKQNCQLNGPILSAPKVYVEDGFIGSIQVIAKDSICIGRKVHLEYPSALHLQPSRDDIKSVVQVKDEAQIEGVVRIEESKSNQSGQFSLSHNAKLIGQAHINGSAEIDGEVYGSIACESIRLESGATVYKNHLLNTKIDGNWMPEYFAGSIHCPGSPSIICDLP